MHASDSLTGDTWTYIKARLSGPWVAVAVFWIAGVAVGLSWGQPGVWLAAAVLTTLGVIVCGRVTKSSRAAGLCGLVAVALVGGGWAAVRTRWLPSDHVLQWLTPQPQLAQVTGTIDDDAYLGPPQRGAFAQFSHESPVTMLVLRLDSIQIDGRAAPVSGRLLVKIEQVDHTLGLGMRIAATGWLSGFTGPANPGERDYRRMFTERGIDGRLTLGRRTNAQLLSHPAPVWVLKRAQRRFADAVVESLRLGLSDQPQVRAFLELILLGRPSADASELYESFRLVGLAHILSISGAHLAILMGLVALAVRLLIHHPPRAALVMLAVLLLYLASVPMQVPIVRSGIMAAVFCIGYGLGRRLRGIESLALAAVLVLLWRPQDLISAGFQLSFGAVAGLLLFTNPVSLWLWRGTSDPHKLHPVPALLLRRGADYLAVNLVASAIALPLAAYHFELVSPMAATWSLVALPVVTAVLWIGYAKIILGLILPSGGILLAHPLEWASDATTSLVNHASTWPGAAVQLHRPPSVLWVIATLGVTVALFCGRFYRRVWALLAVAALCTGWLVVGDRRPTVPWISSGAKPSITLDMFAVGDGSCFLLRLAPEGERGRVLMFDCGSQEFLHAGSNSIVPALRRLNVDRIDTLFVSHADLDHYCGTIDTAEAVAVGEVLTTPQLLAEATARPTLPTAFLVDSFRGRGVKVEPISRGWTWSVGTGEGAIRVDALWPPADLTAKRANDASLVLSVRGAGRRLLLCGDIQQVAITGLLGTDNDVRADVCDLPHHGSFVEASPRWIGAVHPRLVLQSSGPGRLFRDQWADVLRDKSVERLITDRCGMVEVNFDRAGEIRWTTFHQQRGLDRR